MEQQFIETLGFQVVDSCVQPMNAPFGPLPRMTLSEFFNKRSRGSRPRLVYVGKTFTLQLQQQVEKEARAAEFAVVANTSSIPMEVYRDLRENHLYIIRQDLARGIDFSSAGGV